MAPRIADLERVTPEEAKRYGFQAAYHLQRLIDHHPDVFSRLQRRFNSGFRDQTARNSACKGVLDRADWDFNSTSFIEHSSRHSPYRAARRNGALVDGSVEGSSAEAWDDLAVCKRDVKMMERKLRTIDNAEGHVRARREEARREMKQMMAATRPQDSDSDSDSE